MCKTCFIGLREVRANSIAHTGRSFQKLQWKRTFFFLQTRRKKAVFYFILFPPLKEDILWGSKTHIPKVGYSLICAYN
jgi:hypothetical protein